MPPSARLISLPRTSIQVILTCQVRDRKLHAHKCGQIAGLDRRERRRGGGGDGKSASECVSLPSLLPLAVTVVCVWRTRVSVQPGVSPRPSADATETAVTGADLI